MFFLCIGALLIAAKFFMTDVASGSTDTIFLRLYNKNNSFFDINIQHAEQLIPQLKSNEQLVLYIHGFKENADYEGPRIISKAYLEKTDHNVLAVDYREIADMSYLSSVALVGDVGKAIATALDTIVLSDVNATKVHIIGHSLGSQVAGSAARQTKFNVSRITGLDPAGPLFYLLNTHLSAADAQFVDIIHTDMGIYGLAMATGHVDFYVNGGFRPQPGCSTFASIMSDLDLCSHHRSYKFYAESIINDDFLGVKCTNKLLIFRGICNQNEVAAMGYKTPSNTRGNYYLKTDAVSPYGQGLNGIQSYISDDNTI
ncbi:Pancreatic lipase-related protein 2 [Anthophora quadrimaculata]